MAGDDDDDGGASDWGSVMFTLGANAAVFGAMLIVFWALRPRYPSVYAARNHHAPDHTIGALPSGLLNWIPFVYRLSDEEFLRCCGLDALVWIRFQRLGLRLCSTLGVLGFAIVVPVCVTAKGDEVGLARLSMADIEDGSPRLWAPLVMGYVFTAVSVYLLKQEYKAFIKLRHEELRKAQPHHFSVMVEDLPGSLRSDAELKAYFEGMFPGRVLSAVVSSNLQALEAVVEQREELLAKLEHAIVKEELTGRQQFHKRGKCCGQRLRSVDAYNEELEGLNALVAKLQRANAELRAKVEREAEERLHEKGLEMLTTLASVEGLFDVGTKLAGSMTSALTSVDGAKDLASGAVTAALKTPQMLVGTAFEGTKWMTDLLLGTGVSGTGFVTFTKLTACASARQMLLTQEPDSVVVSEAPAPADVYWPAASLSREQITFRNLVLNCGVSAMALFWASIVAAVVSMSSIEQLSHVLPFLKSLSESNPVLMASISGYLPTLALLGLQGLLPVVLEEVFKRAGLKSWSQIQQSVFVYVFIFQMSDLLVIVIAGSLYDSLSDIADNPSSVLSLLGTSLPKSSTLLISYVLVKAFSGTATELARVWPVLRMYQRRLTGGDITPREQRAVLEPDTLNMGQEFPKQVIVLVIALCYSLIAPLTLIPCAFFFGLGLIVSKHNFLKVYVQPFESNGKFFALVFRRAIWAVIVLHVTLIGFFSLKGGYYQLPLCVPLPFLTLLVADATERSFGTSSAHLPLDEAVQLDEHIVPPEDDKAYLQPALAEPAKKKPDLEPVQLRESAVGEALAASGPSPGTATAGDGYHALA